ncbi:S66 peptidase family protein [Streptomyces sp. NPDC002688]|uniref:S66 peptidase family protein n=1 Tax=Streptomyces sp. NPDC002688 TaxID=3154423 RepID=UPI003332659B
MAKWPSPLEPGARLSVWAPSSPAPHAFPRRFARGVQALREDGFSVRTLPSCAAAEGVSTLAPAELAAELHRELRNPECDAVIAAVGGWTLIGVLPHLDWDLIAQSAKPLIGYSDITALLNAVACRSGLVSFHGPMVVSEWGEAGGPWGYTRDQFRTVTSLPASGREHLVEAPADWSDELLWWDKEDSRRRAPRTGGEQIRVLRPAEAPAEGPLWGGNLTVLSLLAGTAYLEQPEGSLVFLEVEAVAPDELAARLWQLRMAGVFDRAAGLVVSRIGRPRACLSGFADYDEVVRTIVPDHLPVAAGYDLGHSEPMTTLPVGGQARLECADGAAPRLVLLPPATR